MSVYIDVVTQYSVIIDHSDLPNNWVEMDHETKDEWIREWIKIEQPVVVSNVISDHGDITWHEDGK